MSEVILQHHGVKGMKWGVRKKREDTRSDIRKRYDSSKASYKSAKKAYAAYNYSRAHPVGQFANKKKSAESDRRWDDAFKKADAANKAQATYKKAKQERKAQINKTYKEVSKQSSVAEKTFFNDATRQKAAKYVVDNNMSMADARKKANRESMRNTAIFVGAYAAVAVGSRLASRQPQYSVLSDTGKVIKNFY